LPPNQIQKSPDLVAQVGRVKFWSLSVSDRHSKRERIGFGLGLVELAEGTAPGAVAGELEDAEDGAVDGLAEEHFGDLILALLVDPLLLDHAIGEEEELGARDLVLVLLDLLVHPFEIGAAKRSGLPHRGHTSRGRELEEPEGTPGEKLTIGQRRIKGRESAVTGATEVVAAEIGFTGVAGGGHEAVLAITVGQAGEVPQLVKGLLEEPRAEQLSVEEWVVRRDWRGGHDCPGAAEGRRAEDAAAAAGVKGRGGEAENPLLRGALAVGREEIDEGVECEVGRRSSGRGGGRELGPIEDPRDELEVAGQLAREPVDQLGLGKGRSEGEEAQRAPVHSVIP
jgi:hypothetical protein